MSTIYHIYDSGRKTSTLNYSTTPTVITEVPTRNVDATQRIGNPAGRGMELSILKSIISIYLTGIFAYNSFVVPTVQFFTIGKYFATVKNRLCSNSKTISRLVNGLDECKSALQYFRKELHSAYMFSGSVRKKAWPKGCYLKKWYFFFNQHKVGKPNKLARQICKQS